MQKDCWDYMHVEVTMAPNDRQMYGDAAVQIAHCMQTRRAKLEDLAAQINAVMSDMREMDVTAVDLQLLLSMVSSPPLRHLPSSVH